MGFNANIHAFIKRAKNLRMLGSSAFCLLILLSLLSIFPIIHHEDQAEAAYIPATTTLSITSASNTASVDITPADSDGTFATSTAASEVAFNVTTNNLTGYNLSINGSDSTGNLTNPIASDTLETITSATDANTFASGSTSAYTNKWGIKPNKLNGTNNTDYLPAPTTSNTITIDNTTASNTEANSYTIGLGARVDYTKPNGTYTNTFTLIAVGNPINYQINYLDNTGATVANLPAAEGNSNVTASSFTLSSTSPTRSGYAFAGWCYGTVDHSTGSSTCTGTTYKPGDQFTFTSLSSGLAVANLYAMWGIPIQNLDPNLCTTGTQTGVVDIRDGNSYTVTKLPDGNCWMTKNLDLAGGTTLTPADSNVSANYTLPASSNNSSSFSNDNTAYVYNSGSTTCGSGSPCYSYYSYPAATAGTNPGGGDATSDICPKGWRLPTQAEYTTLKNTYTNGATLTAAPFFGVYAGYFSRARYYGGGAYGDYWSSTAYNASGAYFLHFDDSNDAAGVGVDSKMVGGSVRCVAKKTMQNFTSADAANMATGDTDTRQDERDGKFYTIAKLPDGNVWMTKNLDLTGGTTLTPADSNVSANYTLPASETISSGTTLANSSAFSDYNTAYVFNSGSTTCSSSSLCYSYYSYKAATAGTDPSSGDATSDICPKGWRLPTKAEYTTLRNRVGATYTTGAPLTAAPFNAVYAGVYSEGSFINGGSSAYYWSSTAYNASNTYRLDFSSSYSNVSPATKGSGYSLRCVAGPRTISSMTNMQDVTSEIAENTPDGATASLKDSRDSKTYTVAKIGDKIWMTKNLDLAGGKTLTPADSNVSANYTLPASETISSGTTLANSSAFSDDNTAYVFNSGSTTCSSSSPCYSYYSYPAATAGTNPETGDATSDICPKGWRLPTQAEYTTLKNTYTTGATLTAAPFNGVYAGAYYHGSFSSGGSRGYYWSSTARDASWAYYLSFGSSDGPGTPRMYDIYKRLGGNIRCVAKT